MIKTALLSLTLLLALTAAAATTTPDITESHSVFYTQVYTSVAPGWTACFEEEPCTWSHEDRRQAICRGGSCIIKAGAKYVMSCDGDTCTYEVSR